jgi:ssDNA-binding Zn-finger/Zn-ribbon topoisomerase 1
LKKKRRNPMPESNGEFCPACGGTGEVKIIKNIAQMGPYHLGKESWEKCNFCSIENKTKLNHKNNERTLH